MNGQTVILGFLFLILPVLVGVFIYLKSRKKLDEPVEQPSIRLLDGSAILNPEENQGDIEGYTIEYYTDEDLTDFVNIKVKWTNLGGFSQVKRLKLTLMNDGTVIQPSKVFSKSVSDDSGYFGEFSTTPLEYTFVGKNVTVGTFIGTIKPKFEYSLTADGTDYQTISTSDILLVINKKDVRLTIESGTPEVIYFYPFINQDNSTDLEPLFREPVTLTSQDQVLPNVVFKPVNRDEYNILSDTGEIYLSTNEAHFSLGSGRFGTISSLGLYAMTESYTTVFNIKHDDPGTSSDHVIIKSGNRVLVVNGGAIYLTDMNDITDDDVWESMKWKISS